MFGSFKLIGIFVIIMAVTLLGFYWYYQNSQKTIAILTGNVARLEVATQLQTETINSLQADFQLANQELARVNTTLAETREQNRILVDKLSEHDLGYLAESRPELVERTINRASDRAGRCFELLSGAQLTEQESQAASAREFNSECPWLWPGQQ